MLYNWYAVHDIRKIAPKGWHIPTDDEWNNTAEQLANVVSKITNIPIKEYLTDPSNIQNAKLQTKCYNFSIDSTKFLNTFNFKFEDTAEIIVNSLIENFDNIVFNSRNKFKHYE